MTAFSKLDDRAPARKRRARKENVRRQTAKAGFATAISGANADSGTASGQSG
jgi:hypothetical protein